MPLIKIRRGARIDDHILNKILESLPTVAAAALACKEGGPLKPKDIMIEVDRMSDSDRNVKDIHIRVIAHDYPARRGDNLAALDEIRMKISAAVTPHLGEHMSWYVWVLLSPTSYGSDDT